MKAEFRAWRARILSEWEKFNNEFRLPKGHTRVALFGDYLYCVLKYHITYSEYFEQYKFYKLKKVERDEYITMSQAHRIQGRLNRGVRDLKDIRHVLLPTLPCALMRILRVSFLLHSRRQ